MPRLPLISFPLLASLATALACGDPYGRTNPYDPQTPIELSLSGPDSLFSSGEFAQYHVLSAPAFPDTAGAWGVAGCGLVCPLKSGGFGRFQVFAPPIEPATQTLTIVVQLGGYDTTNTISNGGGVSFAIPSTAYRRRYTKDVVITQRVTHLQLRCPDSHTCPPRSVGDSLTVWVDCFDALNGPLTGLTSPTGNIFTGAPLVTYVSRDPSVATATPVGIRAASVRALKSGSTWIVASRNSLADSVQVVVK